MRSIGLALVALLLARSVAPADLPASPDRTESAVDFGIEGTEWTSKEEGPSRWNVTYRFESEGRLVYSYNGTTYRNATWKQDGDTVYFEMNNKYRECRATIRADRMEGDSWNTAGNKWKTVMTRAEAKK